MRKKIACLIVSLLGVASLALAGCKTNIDWIDQKICDHQYEFVEITLEPTCTEEGERLMECVDCGKQKMESMEKIPHDEIIMAGKEATCTEDGYTEKIVCNVCQEVLQAQEARSALGHTGAIGENCSTCGEVIYFENATEYELADIQFCEPFVDSWYRFYYSASSSSGTMSISLGSNGHIMFFVNCTSTGQLVATDTADNTLLLNSPGSLLECISGEDESGAYVDVYFESGASLVFADETVEITESLMLEYAEGGVYRIVPKTA